MSSITWLHLTDLHFGLRGQGFLWPNVRDEFFRDLAKIHRKTGAWDLVLFSGDLVQSGTAKEYEALDRVLAELWAEFDRLGARPTLLAIPGNHDLSRPRPDHAAYRALLNWHSDPGLQDIFWESEKNEYRKMIGRVFKSFAEWWARRPAANGVTLQTGLLPGEFAASFEKDGLRLGVVGLNTTFLQLGNGIKEGMLDLDLRQLHAVCGGDPVRWAQDHHVNLLMTHHPPQWLHPSAQSTLNAEIASNDRFLLHLYGHLHEGTSRFFRTGGGTTRRELQGPSLFGLERWEKPDGVRIEREHGYSAGRIALEGDSGELRIWPRRLVRIRSGEWRMVSDQSFGLDEEESFTDTFSVRKPLVAPTAPRESVRADASPPGADVLLVVALDAADTAVDDLLEPLAEVSVHAGVTVRHGLVAAGGGQARLAVALVGEGRARAPEATRQLVGMLKPKILAAVGVSYLLSEDLKLGDVVVATRAHAYARGGKAGPRTPRGPAVRFDPRARETTERWAAVLQRLQHTDPISWNQWVAECVEDRYSRVDPQALETLIRLGLIRDDPILGVGVVASGEVPATGRGELGALIRGQSRDCVALDDDSAGVLEAAAGHLDTLVIRGLFDFGDERAASLRELGSDVLRAWSLRNAVRLLLLFVAHVDFAEELEPTPYTPRPAELQELAEHLHNTVKKEYLDHPYSDENLDLEAHARFFANVTELPDGETAEDLFGWIIAKVWSVGPPDAVSVEGDPGTGKTAFLSVLYWRLWREWNKDPSRPLPIFVSLHRYNRTSRGGRAVQSTAEEVSEELTRHLQPMLDLIAAHPETRLLVIVDGYDNYARFRDELASTLRQIYGPAQYRRIVGLRRPVGDTGDPRPVDAEAMVTLRSMPTDDPAFRDYVSAFAALVPAADPATAERLVQNVVRFDFSEVDLFTLGLLFSSVTKAGRADSVSALLKAHCLEYLEHALPSANRKDDLLGRAAEATFRLRYHEGDPLPETPELPVFLELSDRHPRISDFLVATHVINEIYKANADEERYRNRLGHVFTYSVNRIAKELIPNKSSGLLDHLYKGLHGILLNNRLGPYTKAHACYLLGRITQDQYRGLAKTLLKQFKQTVAKWAEEERNMEQKAPYLLLLRTIYISLTYLGDEDEEEEYVGHLLSKSRWDEINRGFHLEYYEDQEYVPNAPLVNNDKLGPYPKTFGRLFEKLRTESHKDSYQIDLHTFCSLAQHRHAIGKLDDAYRQRTIEIIELALDSGHIRTGELRKFVSMLKRHLGFEHFRVGFLFNDYYHVKFIKRKGWTSRGLVNGENVSDHMYGAYLMAMFLLPDQFPDDPEYKAYSKPRIMEMLLIHDLAEARTDDFLPGERTDPARLKEEEVFSEIALLGTYSEMAVLRDVATLWDEYRMGSTINAQVAKDIDKLENMMQLWIYRAAGATIKDFDDWDKKDIRGKISTDAGRHVLQKLRDFLLNARDELAHRLRVEADGERQLLWKDPEPTGT